MGIPRPVIFATLLVSVLCSSQATSPELVLQRGHSAAVAGLAFTPDGRRLASTGWDGIVKVWDVSSGQIIRSAPFSDCSQLALSPNGHTLALACYDFSIRLWDIAGNGAPVYLKGHKSDLEGLAWSPNGTMIVSASLDKTVKLWDTTTGTLLRTLEGSGPMWATAFSPDGQLVAAAEGGVGGKLWNVSNGSLRTSFKAESPWSVAFSPDGRSLAVGRSGPIDLLDLSEGKSVRTLDEQGKGSVPTISFSPNGRWILSGSQRDKIAKLWDVGTGREVHSFGHKSWVQSAAFSADSRLLATGGEEGDIRLWEADSGKLIRTLSGFQASTTALTFSRDGRWLGVGRWEAAAITGKIWEIPTSKLLDLRQTLGTEMKEYDLQSYLPAVRYVKGPRRCFPHCELEPERA